MQIESLFMQRVGENQPSRNDQFVKRLKPIYIIASSGSTEICFVNQQAQGAEIEGSGGQR